jgi:hypothetical protein
MEMEVGCEAKAKEDDLEFFYEMVEPIEDY